MKLRRKNRIQAQMSMTSLTDVVFILLIFILVTHSIQTEPFLEILLPKSSKKTAAPQPVSIVANADKSLLVDGRKVPWENLPSVLQDVLRRNPGATVSINADDRLKYDDVMTIVYLVNNLDGKPVLALDPI